MKFAIEMKICPEFKHPHQKTGRICLASVILIFYMFKSWPQAYVSPVCWDYGLALSPQDLKQKILQCSLPFTSASYHLFSPNSIPYEGLTL